MVYRTTSNLWGTYKEGTRIPLYWRLRYRSQVTYQDIANDSGQIWTQVWVAPKLRRFLTQSYWAFPTSASMTDPHMSARLLSSTTESGLPISEPFISPPSVLYEPTWGSHGEQFHDYRISTLCVHHNLVGKGVPDHHGHSFPYWVEG